MEKSQEFLEGLNKTLSAAPCKLKIGRHTYFVRQISNRVRQKIALLELEAQVLEGRGKNGVSEKEGRKITRRLYSLHAKEAAYYLLGNWALFVPGLWSLRWRLLSLMGNDVTFQINSAGMIGGDLGFFKANWDTSRQVRALYMSPVGNAGQQWQERLESVLNMLDEDALGIKEDNK